MRRWFVAFCLGGSIIFGGPVFAQQPEPTTPDIIVRPGGEPEAEDTIVIAPRNRALSSPFAQDSLRRQRLEGLDSAARSNKPLDELPQFGTIIDRERLTERAPQTMFDALQQEVGVLMQQTARGQASPYVRGLTGQDVLILIDGIRMNNSTFRSGANQYFNTIDPGMVERIEVIRGPGSTLWGSDAIGGVINVVTRSANMNRGVYTVGSVQEIFSTADSGSYTRVSGESSFRQTGIFGGASYLNVHDLDRGGDLGKQPFTNYDQYAGDIKIDRMLDDNMMLTIALQHFEQDDVPRSDRFAPFALGPPVGTVRPTFFDPQQRDLAYMRLQGTEETPFIDSYMLTVSYARQKEGTREVFTPVRTDFGEFDVDTAGINLVFARDLDWAGRVTYGADYYHDDVDSSKNRVNPNTGVVTPAVSQFPDDSFYERVGIFANWDVWMTERLNVNTGIRYENIDLASTPVVVIDPPPVGGPTINVPTHISPSFQDWIAHVGTVYELTDNLNLVGSISEGFRAPNLDDLVATNTLVQQANQDVPSINLEPVHSVNYEIGYKLDAPRLRSQAFVFWNDLNDYIVRRPGPAAGLFQRANRDSYINGVELYNEYMLTRGWSTFMNFSYIYGQNEIDDIPLSRIPPTQGVLGLRWQDDNHRRWFELNTWLVREQDRLNFQDLTDARIPVGGTPGYQTVNIRSGVTLGEDYNHQVTLNLANVFDQAYRVHGSGVDGSGFNAILGYTYFR